MKVTIKSQQTGQHEAFELVTREDQTNVSAKMKTLSQEFQNQVIRLHSRSRRFNMKFGFTVASILYVVCHGLIVARAQYGGYGEMSKAGYGSSISSYDRGYGSEEEVDERPRVKVGLRVRIPAFRFELPRMSLPKITINAKIRQPNRPRTINLPEINLDTSSKVSAPGFGTMSGETQVTGGDGGYNGGSNYNKPIYKSSSQYNGNMPENVQHFSFSAGEERETKYQSGGYNYNANRHPNEYSSTQLNPYYVLPANQHQANDPDLGFITPVNVNPVMLSRQSTPGIRSSNKMIPKLNLMKDESRNSNNNNNNYFSSEMLGGRNVIARRVNYQH